MKYSRPEMEFVRFTNQDILTESNDTPIMPAEIGDEPASFDQP